MVFPELMRDAVVSKGDHQILLAAKYMQEVKYKSDSRVRVVGLQTHIWAARSPLVFPTSLMSEEQLPHSAAGM